MVESKEGKTYQITGETTGSTPQGTKELLTYLLGEIDWLNYNIMSLMSPLDRLAAITSKLEFSAVVRDEIWTIKRINKILAMYGINWHGKKVLELGAGYGDIGAILACMGADVVCVDARVESLNNGRIKYRNLKNIRFVQRDLDGDIGGFEEGRFDLLIHFGLLYHIQNVEDNLRSCAKLSDEILIDTEVLDSVEDTIAYLDESGTFWGNSIYGKGSRPSPTFIIRILREMGYKVEVHMDRKLNYGFRTYDWLHGEEPKVTPGQRRFFRAWKENDA